jgi:thiol:disulfide interchange protein DsbD
MLWDLTPNVLNISGAGQTLTQGNTFASQFFTGVLAVIVASPCTAPFMASALGVAMVSPPVHTVLIFSSLGVGFAIPMTLLSHSRRFASILPKPGAWMVHFKHFLAFPMLATVIWLVWVFVSQTSSFAQLWLLSGLLLFSLLIWLSHFCNRRPAIMLLLLALVCALLFGYQATKQTSLNVKNTSLNAFSEQKLAQLRKDNQVVFVNMTADWCITCKVNEQVALKDDAFHDLINQPNVHYMVGDWTNKNQEIFEYLQRYERSGVPLYVVYSGEQSYSVLPQVLTTQIVNEAIENALKETNNETTH